MRAAEGGPGDGEVLGCRRDEAEAVEAGGEDRDAVGGHPARGGAEAGDAARRGGDPRAAGGVGGEREQRGAGGDRDRRAAARAAGAAVRVAGVARAGRERAEAELVACASCPRSPRPARRRRATIAASRSATRPFARPSAVGSPATSIRSLTATGMPWSGPSGWRGRVAAAAGAVVVDVDEGAVRLGRGRGSKGMHRGPRAGRRLRRRGGARRPRARSSEPTMSARWRIAPSR